MMTARFNIPVATAVTSTGSSARNQLQMSVKCVISKSMGPCGACDLSKTHPFQLYQSSLMRTETEGMPSSGREGRSSPLRRQRQGLGIGSVICCRKIRCASSRQGHSQVLRNQFHYSEDER